MAAAAGGGVRSTTCSSCCTGPCMPSSEASILTPDMMGHGKMELMMFGNQNPIRRLFFVLPHLHQGRLGGAWRYYRTSYLAGCAAAVLGLQLLSAEYVYCT